MGGWRYYIREFSAMEVCPMYHFTHIHMIKAISLLTAARLGPTQLSAHSDTSVIDLCKEAGHKVRCGSRCEIIIAPAQCTGASIYSTNKLV